ncbi:MAG: O-antigen ligase domain-containing protein [Isosphaeraceae bacterium]
MMRTRCLVLCDRALIVLIGSVPLVGVAAFGGMVSWSRPLLGGLIFLVALGWLARSALAGYWPALGSPMTALGVLAIGLGLVQVAPLPAGLAKRVSPHSQELYTLGFLPERAAEEGLDSIPDAAAVRSPATVDRAATIRWILGGLAALTLFSVVGRFADRLGRSMAVWGCVVAGFLLTTVFGLVQLLGGVGGLYGSIKPGQGPAWAPSTADLWLAPIATVLRPIEDAPGTWAVPVPEPTFCLGGLVGGPGAYLALASLALPLTLGIWLHILSPRGSREPLGLRLRDTGQGSLVVLLALLTLLGSGMVGYLGGRWLALPFVLGLLLAGLPALRGCGVGRWSASMLAGCALAMGLGVFLGDTRGRPEGSHPLAEASGWVEARHAWGEALAIARDFPVLGAGLGSYPAIGTLYKDSDETTVAIQSVPGRWAAEGGLFGLAILGLGVLWGLVRLPWAWKRVGSAERALAGGLLGAVACLAALSTLQWTVEIAAVGLAAVAVLGTWDRWLAGGTDLFVDVV